MTSETNDKNNLDNKVDNFDTNLEKENSTIKNISKSKTEQREIGFEILRIIAMLLITCVHLLNYGGYRANAASKFELGTLQLLYSFFTTAVNVFVLISAYFMIKSKFKWKKLLNLWLSVVFYAISLYVVGMIFFDESFSFKELFFCFNPITRNRYWFFTAYFLLYLVSPFLNKIINNSSKKELYALCLIVFALSYFALRLPIDTISGLNNGYNFIWFIGLYIIGGTLRLYPPKIKRYGWIILYFVFTLLLFANWYIPNDIKFIGYIKNEQEYTAPLVLCASIAIVMSFASIRCKNVKLNSVVRFVSSTTFGIYLLQEAAFFKPHLYFDILKVQSHYAQSSSVVFVIIYALAIFAIGFVWDCLRKFLFWVIGLICSKIKVKRQKVTKNS